MSNIAISEIYMRRALELARQGQGRTLPNPSVGAVIVKDGRIIGEGFHERFGGLHAERNALKNATESPLGADIYVTLEPCSHHGKTPPCTDAIIESGIKRVFTGSADPNPKVSGQGILKLREAGIEVFDGVLKEECDDLNRIFFKFIQSRKPYVCMKYAMSADGKIATKTGDSKWISSEESRKLVHEMRREYPAIMVGIGTVIKDDPMLNCRTEAGVDPIRIVCDSALRIDNKNRIVKSARDIPTFIACAIEGLHEEIIAGADVRPEMEGRYSLRYPGIFGKSDDGASIESLIKDEDLKLKFKALADAGLGIINTCSAGYRVNLNVLMNILGESGIAGVLVEGGGELNFSLLEEGLADEVNVFIGPKLIGGDSKSPVRGEGVERIAEAFQLSLAECRCVGDDVLVRYII